MDVFSLLSILAWWRLLAKRIIVAAIISETFHVLFVKNPLWRLSPDKEYLYEWIITYWLLYQFISFQELKKLLMFACTAKHYFRAKSYNFWPRLFCFPFALSFAKYIRIIIILLSGRLIRRLLDPSNYVCRLFHLLV